MVGTIAGTARDCKPITGAVPPELADSTGRPHPACAKRFTRHDQSSAADRGRSEMSSGERARLACWRSCPLDRELFAFQQVVGRRRDRKADYAAFLVTAFLVFLLSATTGNNTIRAGSAVPS